MKKLIAVLLVLLLAAGCAGCSKKQETDPAAQTPAAAETSAAPASPEIHTSGSYEYVIQADGTAAVVRFTDFDYEGELMIPDSLDGIRVTAIEYDAFGYNSSMPGVTNPNPFPIRWEIPVITSESIDWESYEPDPDTVVSIPIKFLIEGAENGDGTLITDPTYEPVPLETYEPFNNITGITIPEGVTRIGERAFGNCLHLSAVTLPESLTDLESGAFANCKFREITIPDSVIRIGDNPFCSCYQLERIVLSPDHPALEFRDGMLFTKADKRLVCCLAGAASGDCVIPEGTEIVGGSAFYSNASLISVTIPEGVTRIDVAAFASCESLTDVTMPGSLVSIGDYAFQGCSSLSRVILPENLVSIGSYAYGICRSLTAVSIPDSVKNIGDNPFDLCEKLEQIILSPDHPYLKLRDGMLFSKADKRVVCGLNSSLSGNCVIPAETEIIGNYAFDSIIAITAVTLPDSLIRIGDHAFQECSLLTSITIPEKVNEIGDYAFFGTGLKEITVPGNVKKIGRAAFYDCRSLSLVRILDGVCEIGEGAFYEDTSIEKIVIPASVTAIGEEGLSTHGSATVIVVPGSWAEQYCKDNGINYSAAE